VSIPIDRDRLTIRWVAPGDLKPNRWNHRKHPERQRALLKASMEQDGWIDPVIYNERTGSIIDGHARIEEALAQSVEMVPVIAIDVDEEAERRILARHDRIGALAEIDFGLLAENTEGLGLDAIDLGWEGLQPARGFFDDDDGGPSPARTRNPKASLEFPPRVWITHRGEIVAKLEAIANDFGAELEVSDAKQA